MTKITILLIIALGFAKAQTVTNFEKEIVSQFPILQLPIDSVQYIKSKDTLQMIKYNKWLDNSIEKRAVYIYKGKKELEMDYYALLPDGGTPISQGYDKNGKEIPPKVFYTKAYPLGRIELQLNYYSLIVKVFSLLSTYYDIHNFSKEGKLMSVVPLYSFENKKAMQEIVGNLYVRASISKEGKIYWWEYYPRRTRERVYILNKEGFFEIISEKVKGQMEY